MIAAIVLAAGSARRMGRQKLFLDLDGKPILRWTLEAVLASEVDEVVCVARALKEMERLALEHEKLKWISNPKASRGQSTSVIAGLKAISPQSNAALFLVGDQPLVSAELINGLIQLYEERKPVVLVAPTFLGQTRNPVLFDKALFAELLQLTGDRGGRSLIEKYRHKAAFLEWSEAAPFVDLDVWEDYQALKKR